MAHPAPVKLSLPQLHLYPFPPPSRTTIARINLVLQSPPLTLRKNLHQCRSLRRQKSRKVASHTNHHYALEDEEPLSNIPTTSSPIMKENPTHSLSVKFLWGIFTNRWWAELRGAFGQRFNLEGIICSATLISRDRHLLLPHVTAPDIRWIDWSELRRRGFRGVVFDKDNTLTLPYELTLWDPLKPSLDRCKSVFGEANVAVFSNSAGLAEFDPDESKAVAVERAVGLRVIRHRVKKPAGPAEEVEGQLGFRSSELVMVGDRRFTDIVFGNRNGFLTVLTEPLNDKGEPFVVRVIRRVEAFLVREWSKKGLRPIHHCLLPSNEVHLVSLKHPM